MPISPRVLTTVAAAPVILTVVCFFFWSSIIGPENLKGTKHVLQGAKTIPVPVVGPESLEFDSNGEGPYVGVTDGRILKWRGEELGWVDFAYTSPHRDNCSTQHVVPSCGRPLGLSFHRKTGDLYICDGYFGIMKVGPEGGLAELVLDEVEGQKVMFANQMDIDEEEDVFYFNDSSDKFHFGEVFYASISGEKVGRVIRYDMKTKEAKVVMKNLHLPNGLALSKNGSYVLTCEGGTETIHRIWVKGPKAGTNEVLTKIPGSMDNIRRTPTGDFWVALHCKNSLFTHVFLSHPWVGKFFMKTLKMETVIHLMNGGKPHGIVIKISGETGEFIEMLEDSEGNTMNEVFFASISGEKVGRVIRYDMKTKEAKVIMKNLHLPNGLALSKDGSFVLTAEGGTGLIHRIWVKGPKAGTNEVLTKLPGSMDNIRRAPTGDFWVALHCKNSLFTHVFLSHRWIGKFFLKTLKLETVLHLINGGKPHGIVIKISGETGEILEMLEDIEGKTMRYVSEAYEKDGKLWFGSVYWPAVWVIDTSVF